MPKKYTKEDVENWSVEEVKSWLHSKKLTQCLPDFDCVTGYQLLGMTNDDLKALPSLAGNEKKRKALKKAVGQLPGNSISAKTVKSKGKPAKDPPPAENFPPASFEPVPAPPPLLPTSSFHPPPHSPNSATYSDPSLIWDDEDQPQDIYDNPADAREEMLPPPLPPHPAYHQQQGGGGQDGGYGGDDDQMIYEQYEEGEEEEMFDSSFASEEEEEEEEPSALNGLRNSNPGTEANIRAIRAKFFAEGLREHTGILTASIPPSEHQVSGPVEEEGSDDGIYDLPPEELKQHPPHHPVVQPPDLPPPHHHYPDEEEEEGDDIYDVAEEVLKSIGIPMVKAPPPLPQPQAPPTEELYETAAPDEEEETPPLPPFPPSFRDTDPTPPRPPKPTSSPALPRKTQALGSPRPPMRGPIRGGLLPNIPALRPPIQSTPGPRLPLPPAAPPVESESGRVSAATPPPPPPPPPPLSPQTSNPGGSSSPRPWAQKKAPPPPASSSSPFAGGRKFPASSSRRSPSPPRTSENRFPRPSEMKGSGVPVPGKFLGRPALRPVGTKTDGEKQEPSGSKPAVSDKPMSIQERIKLLKKPGGEGGEGRKIQPPPKPADGMSPCTGRKMTKDSSVSDLIKSYHSGGSSTDGEKSRPMSPETKPALPVKPPALSPKHSERSPLPKRHQQTPSGLPEKRSGQPPRKKAASEDQEEQESPRKIWQTVSKKEEGQRPWQRRTSAEEATGNKPPWRKTGEEETADVRPPWRKTEEVSESRPPWRKPSVEEESQPSWKRPTAESPPQEPFPGVSRGSFESYSKSPSKPDLPPPRRTDNASPPDLPPPRRTDNASPPDLPPPRRTDNASPPDLPPPRRTDNASPPDLPPPRRTDNAPPPDLPPPRHKENAPPPPEPPRASDKLKSRFPAPDNAPPERPGRGKSDKARPSEPPRHPLPAERSRFRAPDGPAPSVPKPSVVQEDAPPEVPKMTFLTNNRSRGRVLPAQEEEMPRLPPRPLKLPDRPLPTHGSEPGPDLPQRPWQRPPTASHTVEPGPSSRGTPLGHSWYHANLRDRKVAEARLLQHPRDGTFIIRDSSRTAGEYSLSLLYHGAVKHLRIRLRGDGQYVLGEEKADEVPFASVVELVNYHKKEPLVLKSGGNVTLRYECPH